MQDTIENVSVAYLQFMISIFYLHFSADSTIYEKKISNFFFTHENMTIQPSKVAHNFFLSIANWPKKSPNLNSCSVKIALRATYVHISTLQERLI